MASAFSHAIAAVTIGKVGRVTFWPLTEQKPDLKFWLIGIFCAVIPDADAIGYYMGVPYESMWGHRGITHSFFFAALLSFIVTYFFYGTEKPFSKRWWLLFMLFFIITSSHPILDAMTNGGRGVAFFAPFFDGRYFFPFRPIKVSPLNIPRFFSERGVQVLESEFVWIWIPCGVIYAAALIIDKVRLRQKEVLTK
jgi:inner membrane protein